MLTPFRTSGIFFVLVAVVVTVSKPCKIALHLSQWYVAFVLKFSKDLVLILFGWSRCLFIFNLFIDVLHKSLVYVCICSYWTAALLAYSTHLKLSAKLLCA